MTNLKRSEIGARSATALWTGACLLAALLAAVTPCAADASSAADEFQITGELLEKGDNVSAAGGFRVRGKSVLPSNGIGDREFAIVPREAKSATASGGCPCQALFIDGFESGDLSAWSGSNGFDKRKQGE